MTWNYRIIKKYIPVTSDTFYILTEVFYDKKGKLMAYSDGDNILGSSPEEIIESLEVMLADAKKDQPILTEEDFNNDR
jgi:hypothetical protein